MTAEPLLGTSRQPLAGVRVVDLGLDGQTPEKVRVRSDGRSLLRLDRGGSGGVVGPLTDEVIAVICEHLATISSPLSTVPIFSFGGATSRVSEDATAFPHRDASHDINIVASWLPEQAGDAYRHRAWVAGFFDALAPHSRGVYVNFTSDDAQTRVRDAYSPTQWDRLQALKTTWDPDNVFRGNANIPPLG